MRAKAHTPQHFFRELGENFFRRHQHRQALRRLTRLTHQRYCGPVILSFACEETARMFRAEMSRRFPPTIQRSARRKLLALHAATEIRQMAVPPGNRLEAL